MVGWSMGETQKPALRKMPKGQNGMPRHKAFSAEMIDSCTPAPARPEHMKKMSPRQPHTKDSQIRTAAPFKDVPVDYPQVKSNESYERKNFDGLVSML